MSPEPPSLRIGEYSLGERLGEGGGGQVFRATDGSGRAVAIKLLGPAAELDPEAARARFRREVATLGEVAHPALVTLLAHGVDDELGPYLVMPLLAGTTLRHVLGPRLCPEAAVMLLEPVAAAVAALHARDLVHRDLKPENVMVTPDGGVVVVDLGLVWGPDLSRHTSEGVAVGSVPYMAPEQLEGAGVGTAADSWALGVMLYELVAGKRPFARGRASEEAAATLVGAYAPLDAVEPRCPPELAQLVARCLDRAPGARPPAAQLAAELAALIDWAEPTSWPRERAAIAHAPADYLARVAPFRIRREKRLAREAIEAARPFEALAHVDRALAYAPHDPELLSLAEQAEARSSRVSRVEGASGGSAVDAAPPLATTETRRHAPRSRVLPLALVAIASAGLAVGVTLAVQPDRAEPAAPVAALPGSAEPAAALPAAAPAAAAEAPMPPAPAGDPDAIVAAPKDSPIRGLALLGPAAIPNTGPIRVDEMRAPRGENLVPIERLEQPDPVKAVAEVDANVARSPDSLNRLSQAMVYVAAGRTADGLAKLDALLRDAPDYAPGWAAKSYLDIRAGKPRDAEAAMNRALELAPDDAATLRNRGILRNRLGRAREAYVDLIEALRRDPTDVEAMAELAGIYGLVDRRDDARPLLERIVQLRPDHVVGWLDLSLVQPTPEAIKSVRRALVLAPRLPRAHLRLCNVLAEAGSKDAVAACDEAVQLNAGDPYAWMGRGLARYQIAGDQGGLADVDKAIAMAPRNAQFFINRYILRSHAGLQDAALGDLRQACTLGKKEACDKLK